jgi:hypothetical protein
VIGQEVMRKMKSMGKSIDLKVIDGEFLGAMGDKEIEFAVKNVKTIIIAADTKKIESKGGWFGGGSKKDEKAELIKALNNNVIMNNLNPIDNGAAGAKTLDKIDIGNSDWDQLLNEKSLKKLLNATMKECNKSGNLNIKIITVGKASKQVKSLTSFLGGENTEFDAEVILQCKSRGLGYGIIKVGTLINDDSPVSSPRDRAPKGPKLSGPELEVAQADYVNPVLFTSSRVEPGEFTRLSLAVDALLRSAAHPIMNSTISVLSSASSPPYLPTDAQVSSYLPCKELVLYCTVLYCTALCCTAPYCTVLHSTVMYSIVPYCTVLYCTVMSFSHDGITVSYLFLWIVYYKKSMFHRGRFTLRNNTGLVVRNIIASSPLFSEDRG